MSGPWAVIDDGMRRFPYGPVVRVTEARITINDRGKLRWFTRGSILAVGSELAMLSVAGRVSAIRAELFDEQHKLREAARELHRAALNGATRDIAKGEYA